jgi:uncharacterized protein (DUF433 family)
MLDWKDCKAVERDPAKLSGTWVFSNTRIPVIALFENIEDGATTRQFEEWFPGVTEQQINEVLEFASKSLNVIS